jgi:hypothetical protein
VPAGVVFALKGGAGFDYVTTLKEKRGQDYGPLPDDIALTLAGARTVRVKAEDSAGKPVAGLKVYPWTIQIPGRTEDANIGGCYQTHGVTDAAGVATFDWIPANFEQGLTFLSHSDRYSYFNPFTLKPGSDAAEGSLKLIRMARLSGRVVGADGKPAAGILVQASGSGSAFHNGRGSVKTRADGTYEMTVNGEEAYVVGIVDDRWAAPCKPCVVAREGAVIAGLDFQLAEGTILRGRLTVGADNKSVAGAYLSLQEQGGEFPKELTKPGDTVYHAMYLQRLATTDADGNYRFCVGPGQYTLLQMPVLKAIKITVDRERELVNDINMPRPDFARLAGTVVDADGKPVGGAKISSTYMGDTNRVNFEATTAADGTFSVERVTVPAAVYARTADKAQAGLVRITADQEQVTIRVGPLASARGRLLDHDGTPKAGGRIQYGVRIPANEKPNAPWYTGYGGVAVADADGWYTCTGMLVGEEYDINFEENPDRGPWRGLTKVTPTKAETISLGDTKLAKPYRAPTLEETTTAYFKPRGDLSGRVAVAQKTARKLYQRVLLIVGDPREATTRTFIDLTREQRDVSKAMEDFDTVYVSAEDDAGLAAFREAYDRDQKLTPGPASSRWGTTARYSARCFPR